VRDGAHPPPSEGYCWSSSSFKTKPPWRGSRTKVYSGTPTKCQCSGGWSYWSRRSLPRTYSLSCGFSSPSRQVTSVQRPRKPARSWISSSVASAGTFITAAQGGDDVAVGRQAFGGQTLGQDALQAVVPGLVLRGLRALPVTLAGAGAATVSPGRGGPRASQPSPGRPALEPLGGEVGSGRIRGQALNTPEDGPQHCRAPRAAGGQQGLELALAHLGGQPRLQVELAVGARGRVVRVVLVPRLGVPRQDQVLAPSAPWRS
jgi:hypothetical protein